MSLFKKSCAYCKKKINNREEIFRHVKDPVFVGTKQKVFCCKEHADLFEQKSSCSESCGGGCCG